MRIDAADLLYASKSIAELLLRRRVAGVIPLISTGTVRAAVDGFLLSKLGTYHIDRESQALHDAVMSRLADAAEGGLAP